MKTWTLSNARMHFSEVVRCAERRGPQVITRRGKNVAVIVAHHDSIDHPPKADFKAFLMSAPLEGLNLHRSRRRPRKLPF